MNTPEYEDILASLQALTQRAYQLGRSEALKRVIEVMQAEGTPSRPLALMAPAESALKRGASEASEALSAEAPVATSQPSLSTETDLPTPWWSRPARSMISPIREDGSTTH